MQIFQQLKSLRPNLLQFSSTYPPYPSFHISQKYSYPSSTENPTLSSTNSILKQTSLFFFSFNQSSTIAEEAEESLLGSVKTFPSYQQAMETFSSTLAFSLMILNNRNGFFSHPNFLLMIKILLTNLKLYEKNER